jgi:hypothetical protein
MYVVKASQTVGPVCVERILAPSCGSRRSSARRSANIGSSRPTGFGTGFPAFTWRGAPDCPTNRMHPEKKEHGGGVPWRPGEELNPRRAAWKAVQARFHGRPPASTSVYGTRVWGGAEFLGRVPTFTDVCLHCNSAAVKPAREPPGNRDSSEVSAGSDK